MYQELLRDARLYRLLLRIDEDVAEEAQRRGCPCGGALHRGHFERKPRGGPEAGPEHAVRFSFCCGTEGCRRRMTPPSVRFLGRRVFLATVVLLAPVLRDGGGAERLRSVVGVSRRTVRRWQRWWREGFTQSRVWLGVRARLARPVASETLPGSLLSAVVGSDAGEEVVAVLRLLGPLTAGRGAHAC